MGAALIGLAGTLVASILGLVGVFRLAAVQQKAAVNEARLALYEDLEQSRDEWKRRALEAEAALREQGHA